jgi:hypothetical protein
MRPPESMTEEEVLEWIKQRANFAQKSVDKIKLESDSPIPPQELLDAHKEMVTWNLQDILDGISLLQERRLNS